MKRFLIILSIIQTIIIIGGGFYIYKNYISKPKQETIIDIRKEFELPKETSIISKNIKEEKQVIKSEKSIIKNQTIDTTNKIQKPETTITNVIQTQVPIPEQPTEKVEEKPKNPTSLTDIKVDVDIPKIDIPKVGTELLGGFSASGSLALQQAYEEEHNLNKTIQIANDILKSNPNDQLAQKYKKLAELEIMAIDALNKGDRQSALNYYYQMQSIDPNNKWAKKGIMKIMSGD
jgi:tetratricopeptide (TPR) repeat protein